MSRDLSMFKKMKERITDEVNSATNKLQNMQIIDQLASTIGQQMNKSDIIAPNQLLPEPQEQSSINNLNMISSSSHKSLSSSRNNSDNKFSLIDDSPSVAGFNEDDELNSSEISPQHQLFNEFSIKRINNSNNNGKLSNISIDRNQTQSVITNINELSSDIEDEMCFVDLINDSTKDDDDVEIDLLSDKPIQENNALKNEDNKLNRREIERFKNKYKIVVRTIKKLNQDFLVQKNQLEAQKDQLNNQIHDLKLELDSSKQQQCDSLNSSITNNSETINDNFNFQSKSSNSPQPINKTSQKLKDLEKLLAKCKESLKLKNKQIQTLRDSLGEVEKFKDFNDELKKELAELREAHETWTISIAENKRVMHQEIEDKNSEMEKLKCETSNLQIKLNDSNNKIRQLKSTIQDLESRLVSTSAAHQKERESLTKELTFTKNNAIKQIQLEHEHNLERVKLDLEKTIESLKMDILKKDEQIYTITKEQLELKERNQILGKELDDYKEKLELQLNEFENYKKDNNQFIEKCSKLEAKLVNLNSLKLANEQLETSKKELEVRVENFEKNLSIIENEKLDLERKLTKLNELECKRQEENIIIKNDDKACELCEIHKSTLNSNKEKFQQEIYDLNTQLKLMTTVNEDQEKEISLIKTEKDKINDSFKSLKFDFDELQNKNEYLERIVQENEIDIQNQQEQLDQLIMVGDKLDTLKKQNTSLSGNIYQFKNELNDRNLELMQLGAQAEELSNHLLKYKNDIDIANKTSIELKNERDSLVKIRDDLKKKECDQNRLLVIKILSIIKNLETPNTSPGSDKSYDSTINKISDDITSNDKVVGHDKSTDANLPDPLILMEELSSLALDRTNSYMTATQRLQAVLLDNTMLSEEIKRLKEDLNNLSREKTYETQTSINEFEKLQAENQALIHDQQSYEDRIKYLEDEIENIKKSYMDKIENQKICYQEKLSEINALKQKLDEKQQAQEIVLENQYPPEDANHTYQIKALKRLLEQYQQENCRLKENQKRLNSELSKDKSQQQDEIVLDSTQFEYLKNIVYQFMLRKEPLVLARVISAVFKFDKNQIDQICKVQETVQSALKQLV